MTLRDEHIGCIDGRTLTVRRGPDDVVLGIGGSEARLSMEAAERLAAQLLPASSTEGSSPEPARPEEPTPKKQPKSSEEVTDLIEAGLLRIGTDITMTYGGESYVATIAPEGEIKIGAHSYRWLSGASQHVAGTKRNGWKDWRVIDGPRLVDLRWRLRAQSFFAGDDSYSDSTIAEKQRIALRWVEYALDTGLGPGKRNEDAVSDFLAGHNYAESTLANYRRHLEQWFEEWETPN